MKKIILSLGIMVLTATSVFASEMVSENSRLENRLPICIVFPGYGTVMINCTKIYNNPFAGTPRTVAKASFYVQSNVCSSVQISEIDINDYVRANCREK